MKKNISVRRMSDADSERVLEIYKMGIETRNATFETVIPSWVEWDANHHRHSRFVAEIDGKTAGWVALSPVSNRDAYKGVAEISVYIDTDYLRKGLGTRLMKKVIPSSEENGIWTLYSSVFPENEGSVKLHMNLGFRMVGRREKIGYLDDRWRDVIILERRSKKAGLSRINL